jgi:hypothetical protein
MILISQLHHVRLALRRRLPELFLRSTGREAAFAVNE